MSCRVTTLLTILAAALTLPPGASAVSFPADPDSLGVIPPLGCAQNPRDVTFEVTGVQPALGVGDVSISGLVGDHSVVGNIDARLIAPGGAASHLIFPSDRTNGTSSNFVGPYRFSDRATAPPHGGWRQATRSVGGDDPVPPGTYWSSSASGVRTAITPAFAGVSDPNGTWTLRFTDCPGWTGVPAGSVSAATLELEPAIAVTTLADDGPGSLRQAIAEANATGWSQLVAFDEGLQGAIELESALPDLSDDVEIRGPGAELLEVRRAESAPDFTVFTHTGEGTSTISGLTVSNGAASDNGGGIANGGGTLILDRLVVRGNTGPVAGGVINNGGTMVVRRSTIDDNTAAGHTGGIGNFNGGATLTIEATTVSGNVAGTGGGGVLAGAGSGLVTIRQSTVAGNEASDGGGMVIAAGVADVESSTIGANSATTTAANVRVDGGSVSFNGTIIAGEDGASSCAGAGTILSEGFNLTSDASCGLDLPTDQPSTDPQLGPLQDNGGPTETMAPGPISPALDQGQAGSMTADQRGLARKVDLPAIGNAAAGGADVGAVELQAGEISPAQAWITGGPSGATADTQPTFTFEIADAVGFECSLDDGIRSFGPCSEPTSHTAPAGLADGEWTFRVRARNAKNEESTATRSFTVDTLGPVVDITNGPAEGAKVETGAVSFAFTADGPGSSFECRLDGGAFQPCSSPKAYVGLTDGPHGFRVRATDEAGNIGPGLGRLFTVQTAATPAPSVTSEACVQAEAARAGAARTLNQAKEKLKQAKKKLKKAKARGDAGAISRAKKKVERATGKVRKASAKLAEAEDAVQTACV